MLSLAFPGKVFHRVVFLHCRSESIHSDNTRSFCCGIVLCQFTIWSVLIESKSTSFYEHNFIEIFNFALKCHKSNDYNRQTR